MKLIKPQPLFIKYLGICIYIYISIVDEYRSHEYRLKFNFETSFVKVPLPGTDYFRAGNVISVNVCIIVVDLYSIVFKEVTWQLGQNVGFFGQTMPGVVATIIYFKEILGGEVMKR